MGSAGDSVCAKLEPTYDKEGFCECEPPNAGSQSHHCKG